MLQAQAALLQLHAPLVFLPLLVTWNNLAMLSIFRSEILLMGSKYGLHLCACSLITTCRWSLRCNWGEHSLVKLTLLFIRTSSSERLMRVMSLQQPYVLHTSRTESSVLQFTVSSQCYEDTFSTCTCHENYTSWELHIMRTTYHEKKAMPPRWQCLRSKWSSEYVSILLSGGSPLLRGVSTNLFLSGFVIIASSKECNMHLWRTAYVQGARLNLDLFVSSKWYCVGNFVASENHRSCQYARRILWQKRCCSVQKLAQEVLWLVVLYEKERWQNQTFQVTCFWTPT